MDNGLPTLLGDRAPAFRQEIEQYGGCVGNVNLAYYYPSSKEVVYIGHVYQMGVTQSFDVHEVRYGGWLVPFRGRQRPTEVNLNVYVDRLLFRNVEHIVKRYYDAAYGNTVGMLNDYFGTLIGYFDLANGDQLRFMFPRFLLTSYEIKEDFILSDAPLRMNIDGQFSQGSIADISYMRIEETKKIDYSKVQRLESLND